MMENNEVVKNLRSVMGTLPSEQPEKSTNILQMEDTFEVTLEDYSSNPYRAMFVSATSTWGNNEFEQKWDKTSIEGKLEVIKAVLCHKTLPQAKEAVMFTFRVAKVPRYIFDYHTQTVNFCFFMSQGCRDNNRIDADILLSEKQFIDSLLFKNLKDMYEFCLSDNGSWQSARSFLPLSYCHSYHFGQNLLSIISTRGFHASGNFGNDNKEVKLKLIYEKVIKSIGKKFPLLEMYLQLLFIKDKKYVYNNISKLTVKDLEFSDYQLLNKNEL